MFNHDQHLSEEELLRAVDGELGRRTRKARAHLAACAACKTNAARLEATIAEWTRAQKEGFEAEIPSIAGPRALLRARLAEVSPRASSFPSRHRFTAGRLLGTFGIVALAAVAVCACVLAFRHSRATSRYSSFAFSDESVLPNRDFTPGAARQAKLQEICASAREEVVKEVSPAQRQKVFEEYGIPGARSDEYEVDYLITPGLGGEDDIRNLWPEPYHSAAWNAHLKDALEERLHEMVCSDRLDLAVAQKAIASNWIEAYQKYVSSDPPKVNGAKEL